MMFHRLLSTGWARLTTLADFLVTACSLHMRHIAKDVSEASDAGTSLSSMQNTVLASLNIEEASSYSRSMTALWTPHSASAFLPCATATLGVAKGLRDCLGGWRAQGSDRYARVAARMITDLQSSTPTKKVRPKTRVRRQKTARQPDDFLCTKRTAPKNERSASRTSKKRALSQHPEGCETAPRCKNVASKRSCTRA